MKKKLLFIIDSLGSGGAEKSLISLLPLIDYARYDVDLIIFERGGVYEKYVPKEVRIVDYDLYESNFLGKMKELLCHALLSPQLRLNKKRHGAEIHWRTMHGMYHSFPGVYDAAIAYQQGVPTFFLATKVNAKKKLAWINVNIFAAGYNILYCEKFYNRIDNIVVVSQELYRLVHNEMPSIRDKVRCIYDIVNQDVIRRMSHSPISDMDVSDKRFVNIVTVGRLASQKNYMLAVDSAYILKKQGLSFKWYFVGDGEQRQRLQDKIHILGLQHHIVLLGFKENPYPYMRKADVYVQTSSFEGFGLTIAEAKILHCPIVSTNFDVVKDQIEDGKNGLIADMKPESVADRIMVLLHDESLRNQIIKNLEKESNMTSSTEIQKFNKLIEV